MGATWQQLARKQPSLAASARAAALRSSHRVVVVVVVVAAQHTVMLAPAFPPAVSRAVETAHGSARNSQHAGKD